MRDFHPLATDLVTLLLRAVTLLEQLYLELEPESTMRNLIALTIILLLTASAEASHASRLGPDLTYSCDTVRWASTKFTHEQLLAYAKEYGITTKQRRQAQGCMDTAAKTN
jgi:hypothetical protein